jgi:hypothetical protein
MAREARFPNAAAGAALAVFVIATTFPRGADTSIKLVDVAEPAGLTLLNLHGGPSKDYIVDANGNGAALFD